MSKNSDPVPVSGVTEEDVEQLQRTIAIDRRYANTYRTAIEEAPTATDAKQASDRLRECEARIASGSRILAACERDRTRGASPREAVGRETIRRAFLAGVLYVLGDEGITSDHEEMARVYAERTRASAPGVYVSEELYNRLMAGTAPAGGGMEPNDMEGEELLDSFFRSVGMPDAILDEDDEDDGCLVIRVNRTQFENGAIAFLSRARSDAGGSETRPKRRERRVLTADDRAHIELAADRAAAPRERAEAEPTRRVPNEAIWEVWVEAVLPDCVHDSRHGSRQAAEEHLAWRQTIRPGNQYFLVRATTRREVVETEERT